MNLLKFFKRKEVYVCPEFDGYVQVGKPKKVSWKTTATYGSKDKTYYFTACTPEAKRILKEKPFKKMTAGEVFLSQLKMKGKTK